MKKNRIKHEMTSDSLKGKLNGNCNRTACQKPEAIYFNHSTEKYYCPGCADLINKANQDYSMRLFGHNLCLHYSKLSEK